MAGILRLLPDPDRAYSALRDDLVTLGWQWADELQQPPTLESEPEWVRYRHPAGAELEYGFLPPLGLRSIVARGDPDALLQLSAVPQLRPDDLRMLLDQPAAEPVLRGVLGAQALLHLPLLPRIRELARQHPDPLVRGTADQVATRLPGLAAEALRDWQAERAATPGRSVLLSAMPVAERRQVLRWLGADGQQVTAGSLEVLRTGLADGDPEVRATAAVVAARLAATELSAAVASIAVPADLREPVHRSVAALAEGERLLVPEPADAAELLLVALALPLPDVPAPDRLPPHLWTGAGTAGVVGLRRSDLPVALVPAIPHWLITSRPDPVRAAARQVRPEPFVMTSAPVQAGIARRVGLRVQGADDEPACVGEEEAIELARRVSALEGVPLEPVDRRRWECALRGPDGRRWTSGNSGPAGVAVSPWGALAVPGVRERLAGGLSADCDDLGGAEPVRPDTRLPVRLAVRFPL